MADSGNRKARFTRRELLRTSALGLAGLTLAACSPAPAAEPTKAPAAGGSSPTQPSAPAPTKAPAPTAAAATKTKQDVIMGISTDVVSMDARTLQSDLQYSMIHHVVEPPLFPDDATAKLFGVLLAGWEPIIDPPGWRLKLRPGVTFTNGEPFNAQAVKFSIESILDENNKAWIHSSPRTQLASLTGVKVEDDLTVVISTKTFYRGLPKKMCGMTPMLPAKYGAEKGKDFGAQPIGTGHYKFVEYRSQSHLLLEANPQYNGAWEGQAKNTSVRFRFLTENATRMAALEAGEVHLVNNVPPDAVDRIKKNSNLQVLASPTNRIDAMYMHCGRPPFNNLKARLAVAHGIDRKAIVSSIMGGLVELADQPFPPGTDGVQGETFKPYEFDLAKAKRYFSEAGLTNGTKIKLGGPVGRYTNDKQVVTAVASMLSDIGFQPELEQLGFGVYYPKVTAGDYDMFYLGWSTPAYDPVDFQEVYTGFGPDNAGATHFVEHNAKLLELFRLANTATSDQEATRHNKELAHLIWDNQPIVHLFYEPNLTGVSKKLQGWKPRRDTYVYLWSATLA